MSDKTFKHEASGAELAKQIAQPHVESFHDCFTGWAWRDVSDRKAKEPFESRKIEYGKESMLVTPFCQWRTADNDIEFFSVRPADWVYSRIVERMIVIDNDRITFELVSHDNGWTLVLAKFGQIIGDCWLAYVKTDTIPSKVKEAI